MIEDESDDIQSLVSAAGAAAFDLDVIMASKSKYYPPPCGLQGEEEQKMMMMAAENEKLPVQHHSDRSSAVQTASLESSERQQW